MSLSGESYFRLGLDYNEILLYLVFFHGSTSSLRLFKRIVLKTKGLGKRRNLSKLREVCQAVEGELRGSRISVGDRQVIQKVDIKSRQKVGMKIAKNLDKKVDKKVAKNVDKKSRQKSRQKSLQKCDKKVSKKVDKKATEEGLNGVNR